MPTCGSALAGAAACVVATLAVAAAAAAAQLPLGGHAHTALDHGRAGRVVRVVVRDHRIPIARQGRACEGASLRVLLDASDSGEVALACAPGRPRSDRRWRGAHGLELRVSPDRLELTMPLKAHGLRRPRELIELRLQLGPDAWCGRLDDPFARRWQRGRHVAPCRALHPRPNVLLIVLDDARADGVDLMPQALSRIADAGVRFEHASAPSSVCAPSRASLLTGLDLRRHGVRQTLQSPDGLSPAERFRETGGEHETLAVWLQRTGYRTGLFGKYINGYADGAAAAPAGSGPLHVPPGWDRWRALASPEHAGGVHGETYALVDESGVAHVYDGHADDADYGTDVTASALRDFVREADAEGRPFFAYWAPYAPHHELPQLRPAPADRHFGSLETLAPWRPPSWNEPDVSDKPRYLEVPTAAEREQSAAATDEQRIRGYEALLSVDEQIGLTLDLLRELRIRRDTIVVFTSDNGASWGEHRRFQMTKNCGYEECQRVPLFISWPRRISAGRTIGETAALNADIAPTVAALAGAPMPAGLDGESLVGWLLEGAERPAPRADYLIESWRVIRSASLSHAGQPRDGDRIELILSDLEHRPRERVAFEFDGDGRPGAGAIAVPILARARDTFDALARAIQATLPELGVVRIGNLVAVVDPRPGDHGVYIQEILDARDVIRTDALTPDHFGVRDVASDYTWLEYETGETELYDLRSDPGQLDNLADDPRYAAVRERLAARLAELLGAGAGE